MKTKASFIILFIAFALTSCGPAPLATATQQTLQKMEAPTFTPIPTLTVTALPIPKATKTVLPTPTSPQNGIIEQCLEISTTQPVAFEKKAGTLVIAQDRTSSEIYDKLASPYLLDFSTGVKKPIYGHSFAVSPDQSQLAYVSNNDLIIMDKAGDVLQKLPFPDISLIQWVNDGVLTKNQMELALFNTTTGERKILKQELPDKYLEDRYLDWSPSVLYDPSLTKVVYVNYNKQTIKTYIALWDVDNQKEIASVGFGPALAILPFAQPQWSTDGQQVIISSFESNHLSARKFFSLSKDGITTSIWDVPEKVGTINFSLSPNQELIAFWSPNPSSELQIMNSSLHLLNIKTEEVINYCIISPDIPPHPVWSPDSTKLALELRQDLGNSEVIIVDIQNNLAVKIADDAQPVGWLK